MKSDDQVDVSEDKYSSPTYRHDKGAAPYVSSDTDLGDVEAVETTKRGLKARHAQMIALGGTIGELPRFPEISSF
jgi:amino acid transporter